MKRYSDTNCDKHINLSNVLYVARRDGGRGRRKFLESLKCGVYLFLFNKVVEIILKLALHDNVHNNWWKSSCLGPGRAKGTQTQPFIKVVPVQPRPFFFFFGFLSSFWQIYRHPRVKKYLIRTLYHLIMLGPFINESHFLGPSIAWSWTPLIASCRPGWILSSFWGWILMTE